MMPIDKISTSVASRTSAIKPRSKLVIVAMDIANVLKQLISVANVTSLALFVVLTKGVLLIPASGSAADTAAFRIVAILTAVLTSILFRFAFPSIEDFVVRYYESVCNRAYYGDKK